MSYYIIKSKHLIPGFLFLAVASWAVALVGMTIFGIVSWTIDATVHLSLLEMAPWPLKAVLGVCGAYGGGGALCLYVTMWVYWIAVERGTILARIGWLLALLLGLHYGALIYAFVVWRKDVKKVNGPQPAGGPGPGRSEHNH